MTTDAKLLAPLSPAQWLRNIVPHNYPPGADPTANWTSDGGVWSSTVGEVVFWGPPVPAPGHRGSHAEATARLKREGFIGLYAPAPAAKEAPPEVPAPPLPKAQRRPLPPPPADPQLEQPQLLLAAFEKAKRRKRTTRLDLLACVDEAGGVDINRLYDAVTRLPRADLTPWLENFSLAVVALRAEACPPDAPAQGEPTPLERPLEAPLVAGTPPGDKSPVPSPAPAATPRPRAARLAGRGRRGGGDEAPAAGTSTEPRKSRLERIAAGEK